jgi:indole-3-glycerol phosphate synthase
VQASRIWSPPSGTLGALVAAAHVRAEQLASKGAELDAQARAAGPAPSLFAALQRDHVGVIAEVKRRSPSKGWINPGLSAADQAAAYEHGGAAAISVLTEPDQFGGDPEDIRRVRARVQLPVLEKDFHVAPVQLTQARALGASAALLIVRALSPDDLRRMMDAGARLGLELLVEAHDAEELDAALEAGATLVGVNNRNLETLEMDPANAASLLPRVPAGVVAVAESGVATPTDVEDAAAAGADAVLVGSSISASSDPAQAVRGLAHVRRVGRA